MHLRLLDFYLSLVSTRPKLCLAILAFVVAIFVLPASQIVLDNDVRQLVSQNDAEEVFLAEHNDLFGPDDTSLIIVLQSKKSTLESIISFIDTLSTKLETIDGVARIRSVTHSPIFAADDSEVRITTAFGKNSVLQNTFSKRLELLSRSAIGQALLSKDKQSTLVIVEMEPHYRNINLISPPARKIVSILEDALQQSNQEIDYQLAGIPFTRVASVDTMQEDLLWLMPISSLVICLLLFIIFRRRHAVLLPMLAVGSSLIITLGIISLLGEVITPLSLIFPTLLLSIGVADGVHFLSRYHEERRKGLSWDAAVKTTSRYVGRACLLTSFTSAVGFASLYLTNMKVLHSFGLVTALGILVAFLVVLTLVPAGLHLSHSPPIKASTWTSNLLERFIRWTIIPKHAVLITVIGVLLTSYGIHLSSNVEVDYFFTKILNPKNVVSRGNELLEKRFAGLLPIEVNFSGEPETFKEPDILERLDKVAEIIRQEEPVASPISIASIVKELNREVANKQEIPKNRSTVAQLLLLVEGDADAITERYVSDDFAIARVSFRSRDLGGNATLRLKERLETRFAHVFAGTKVKAKVTGIVPLSALGFNALVNELVRSLLVALAIIIGTIAVVFRSIRLAVVSILPNIMPLIGVIAYFGFTGHYLDLFPAVTFCIAIGIAVDDTIHLIARYNEEVSNGLDHNEAIVNAVTHSLLAVVNTSVILIFSFLVLVFSEFPANQIFGILGSTIILLALAAELIFTPAALAIMKAK